MKKKFLGKNSKFSMLVFVVFSVHMQACEAYKLSCPDPNSIVGKRSKNQYEYTAKMKMDKEGHDKSIIMKGFHNEKLDLSSLSFVAASSSRDNRLFCSYADPKASEGSGILNLVAPLKKGNTCTVTYPKGHEHPQLSYFECKD